MNVLYIRVDDRRTNDVLCQLFIQAYSYVFAFTPLRVAGDVEAMAR
jgi:hypothetical protein